MRMMMVAALAALGGTTARADQCDVQTAEVVQATGARFDHRSPSGDNVFLKHPLVREFVMNCRDKVGVGPGNVSLSFDGAYPSNNYFDLVATAAAASLHVPAAEVRKMAVLCHKTALTDSEEMAEATSKVAKVECQSFRRDGGGTLISVWPPQKE